MNKRVKVSFSSLANFLGSQLLSDIQDIFRIMKNNKKLIDYIFFLPDRYVESWCRYTGNSPPLPHHPDTLPGQAVGSVIVVPELTQPPVLVPVNVPVNVAILDRSD